MPLLENMFLNTNAKLEIIAPIKPENQKSKNQIKYLNDLSLIQETLMI